MRKVEFLGFHVCAENAALCAQAALQRAAEGPPATVVACLNPHSIVVASNDDAFCDALQRADMLLPDGIGVVLGARCMRRMLDGRVAGMDFFLETSRLANERGDLSYFFLGATDAVLKRIVARLQEEYPRIKVAGVYSPPFVETFSDEQNRQIINTINSSGADVLWVGITAPKQEKWIHTNAGKLDVRMAGAIGAVFDFYARTKERAPEWICGIGLEWLWRLMREPRRLWQRSVVSGPIYVHMVIRELLSGLLASKG